MKIHLNSRFSKAALTSATIAMSVLAASAPATAGTIWTDWTSHTAGFPGSASGTLNGVAVSYSGEVLSNTVTSGTTADWSNPATSFVGGTVTTAPTPAFGIITEGGISTGTNTLTFASPIVNPVFAIWSLGQPGAPASFTFDLAPSFEAGGPDIYGGGPITVSGNVVNGREGSGVVQFTGTVSSISWTDTPEFYYGFTVGVSGAASSVPEPASFVLLCGGLVGLGIVRRLKKTA